MKIAIHSDLHMEFWRLSPEFLSNQDFDILILAGDITTSKKFMYHLKDIRDLVPVEKPIIFVPGNHDYYGTSIEDGREHFKYVCDFLKINYLDRSIFEFGGYRFIGVTGWSTMDSVSYTDEIGLIGLKSQISDFGYITKHTPWKMVQEGKKDKEFVQHVINDHSIVISHFCPIVSGFTGRFPISNLTNYFYNDWSEIFERNNHLLHVYGHTHSNICQRVDGIRCISNQRGYPSEENYTNYNPNFIIEI